MTFVDRDKEQNHFLELLRCEDHAARLLTIQAQGGMGKSSLLQLYEDKCYYRTPRIPVCRMMLEDNKSYPSPWQFITKAIKELEMHELKFPEFERLNLARLNGNFAPFAGDSAISGYMDARDSTNYGVSGGIVTQAPQARTVNVSSSSQLTPEQDETAREKCIEAFFQDLKQSTEDDPVVLLLDTWEKGNDDLKKWIERYLLPRYVFDLSNRPAKFLVVLAGRTVPDFQASLGEAYTALISAIGSFVEWDENIVWDFLSAHGRDQVGNDDVQYLCRKIKEGWPLVKALQMVDEYIQGS